MSRGEDAAASVSAGLTLRRLSSRDSEGRADGRTNGTAGRTPSELLAALPANRQVVAASWRGWLAPSFADNDSAYFTGTYSDEYGYPHGLMAVRNVHKDFRAWLESWGFDKNYMVGVEPHRYRLVLHLHAVLAGPFTAAQLAFLKSWWEFDRGWARALPVLDGCASYVTKYALKGDTDSFEWRLSS